MRTNKQFIHAFYDPDLPFNMTLGEDPEVGERVTMYEPAAKKEGGVIVKEYVVVKIFPHIILCRDKRGMMRGFNKNAYHIYKRKRGK